MRIVIVGHVDHGKSTLVGRLFHDTGSLPTGKLKQIEASCRKRSVAFEWAFLMDALQAERDQNITIDVSQIWFRTGRRPYVLIDAPGHKEFLKNMITGAASADAALLLIAANEGVREQSRRHGYMLSLLGIRQVAVVVNKMDLVGYSQPVFQKIETEYRAFLKEVGVEPRVFIPVSARQGDNIAVQATRSMPWHPGPTVLDVLDDFEQPKATGDLPLRLPIQDIYRFDARRIVAGRIEAGTLRVGDELVFSPYNKTGVVATIEQWPGGGEPRKVAGAGESVGITLTEQIFVERGHVASHREEAPIESNRIKANLFWMGRRPLALHGHYKIRLATQEMDCQVASIERVIDASTLEVPAGRDGLDGGTSAKAGGGPILFVERNDVAEITLQTRKPLVIDNHDRIPALGRFVLVDELEVSGGGIIFGGVYTDRHRVVSQNITWSESAVTNADRSRRNGHKGAVVWLTGLSGAGKSTIAKALERDLFERRFHVYVLDGDNIRHGLNSNLGFSPEDRLENIRRVGEVARLMADSGTVTITAFISPYRTDRRRAREIALEGGCDFIEVYVNASLETCERRDPKNLYKKARAGEIKQFTGIDAPYEAPVDAEIVVHTDQQTAVESVRAIMDQLLPRLSIE